MNTYEKKYKEALERAKTLQKTCDSQAVVGWCEYLFPELKESEDEKVRKGIIELVRQSSEILEKKNQEQMLAWLEKQGSEPNWCHHKVDLSNCSEEYRKAYYDGWNNCYMQYSQCKSEGNNVVKCLINGMKFYYEDNEDATWGTEKFSMKVKDIIKWLERQGEQKPVFEMKSAEESLGVDSDTYNKIVDECIYGEQKPINKVVPKFQNGQWIVWQNKCYKVNYNGCGYELIDQNGLSTSLEYETIDENAHLWDITKDAKDGDVLVASDDSIFLFKGTIDCACKHYVALTTDGVVELNEGLEHYWETSRATHPATKEQSDLLFQKMKEAGYEWDAKKKELKKIEQKPATMSLDEAIEHCKEKSCGNSACALEHKQLEKWLTELKELKEQKPAWSEDDENVLEDIEEAIINYWHGDMQDILLGWLKSIKQRIGG